MRTTHYKIVTAIILSTILIFDKAKALNVLHNYSAADTVSINVKDYGATGNGTTDDYSAIAKALAVNSTALKVRFAPGKYLVSRALKTTHAGTVISFDKGAVLYTPSATGAIILANNGCRVQNATIVGNGQSAKTLREGYGVLLMGVSNCQVTNSTFDRISGVSILLLNDGARGTSQNTISGNKIIRPAFDRDTVQDAAGIMLGYSGRGYSHTGNVISGNNIDGAGTLAHGIALITHGKGNTISKNIVKRCLRYGIITYESSKELNSLTGNNILYNTVSQIGTPGKASSVYGMGIYLMSNSYSVVRGNVLTDCLLNTNGNETLPGGAIALNGATNCTVDKNTINNSGRYGIACSMAFNSTVTNNTINGAAESGIYLINTAYNKIQNNTIKNASVYAIKGRFGNTSRPNYAAALDNTPYQKLSTGQGIDISNNKIYTQKPKSIVLAGENADSKMNYKGNKLDKISIYNNTFIGNANNDDIIISDKAINSTNKVFGNKFQRQ